MKEGLAHSLVELLSSYNVLHVRLDVFPLLVGDLRQIGRRTYSGRLLLPLSTPPPIVLVSLRLLLHLFLHLSALRSLLFSSSPCTRKCAHARVLKQRVGTLFCAPHLLRMHVKDAHRPLRQLPTHVTKAPHGKAAVTQQNKPPAPGKSVNSDQLLSSQVGAGVAGFIRGESQGFDEIGIWTCLRARATESSGKGTDSQGAGDKLVTRVLASGPDEGDVSLYEADCSPLCLHRVDQTLLQERMMHLLRLLARHTKRSERIRDEAARNMRAPAAWFGHAGGVVAGLFSWRAPWHGHKS